MISKTKNISLVRDVKKISKQYKPNDKDLDKNDDNEGGGSRFNEPLKFGLNYKLSNKNKKKWFKSWFLLKNMLILYCC